jgi:hypothetical protein
MAEDKNNGSSRALLSELLDEPVDKSTKNVDVSAIAEASEQAGFANTVKGGELKVVNKGSKSTSAKGEGGTTRRRRKVKASPHTATISTRARTGMKDLVIEIADELELYDYEVFEEAMLALCKKHKLKDISSKLTKLLKE